MSFSQEVKRELCGLKLEKDCDARSECYGLLMFANQFRPHGIRIITGNKDIAERIPYLFGRVFHIEISPKENGGQGRYVFEIAKPVEIAQVFDTFGLDPAAPGVRLNRALLEEECCRNAFIRGAFLSGGSVSDPGSRYHLEFVTPHYIFSTEMMAFLMDAEFDPKVTRRQANYVIYFKASEAIEDLLVSAGAPLASLKVMQTKVVKDVRNKINRSVNCETANISKTVGASAAQVRAIRKLEAGGILQLQPETVREAARLRLENPEASLAALAEQANPPVSRATMNYRLKKLVELADE